MSHIALDLELKTKHSEENLGSKLKVIWWIPYSVFPSWLTLSNFFNSRTYFSICKMVIQMPFFGRC